MKTLRLNWLGEEGKYIVIRTGMYILAYYVSEAGHWKIVTQPKNEEDDEL